MFDVRYARFKYVENNEIFFEFELDDSLEGAFVSAIKDATDYSSEETLKIVLRYLCKDTKTAFDVKIKGTI